MPLAALELPETIDPAIVPSEGTTDSATDRQQLRAYRPELDAARLFAFLMVFVYHNISAYSSSRSPEMAAMPSLGAHPGWRVFLWVNETCSMGLCLFFTLSAYLVTEIMFAEYERLGRISVGRFYLRRALRIWPLYWFGIAIGIAAAALLHRPNDIVAFYWFLAFAGNFYLCQNGGITNPMINLWSISIVEQFYLVWPWAVRWLSRRGLAICAVLMVVAANVTLFAKGQRHLDTGMQVWPDTLVQFQMFAAGILLSLFGRRGDKSKPLLGSGVVLGGIAMWAVAGIRFQYHQPAAAGLAIDGWSLMLGYGMVALGCVAILSGFATIGPEMIPGWVARAGKLSYGLYVFHELAIWFAVNCFTRFHGFVFLGATAVCALTVTLALAVLSYEFLESPFLRIKWRFEAIHTRAVSVRLGTPMAVRFTLGQSGIEGRGSVTIPTQFGER